MRRREFIGLLGGAATTWPLRARAQQTERARRIGVLMGGANDAEGQARFAAFRKGLQLRGWKEGSLLIDERWSVGDIDRIRANAVDLLGLKPDVVLAGGIIALTVLRQETRQVPIVFVGTNDPVRQGFVESMARPGGNITGFSVFEASLIGKMLEILKEVAPQVARAALLVNLNNDSWTYHQRSFEASATSLAVQPTTIVIRGRAEIEPAIAAFARELQGGLIVPPDVFMAAHRELIATLAAHHGMAAVYPYRAFVSSGGLMSYGVEQTELFHQAASYVDRILQGEKPADLPAQAPTKIELVINLKTARAVGLTVPPSLLARADEVIE